MAGSGSRSLATTYDLVMFDLDGVVYVDGHAVEHAAESIAATRDGGAHIAFITNNASRTPEQVAAHLEELGVRADPADVVTSSQAAARLLREAAGPADPRPNPLLRASGDDAAAAWDRSEPGTLHLTPRPPLRRD